MFKNNYCWTTNIKITHHSFLGWVGLIADSALHFPPGTTTLAQLCKVYCSTMYCTLSRLSPVCVSNNSSCVVLAKTEIVAEKSTKLVITAPTGSELYAVLADDYWRRSKFGSRCIRIARSICCIPVDKYPSCLHTTVASLASHLSSQMVPQALLIQISTLPSLGRLAPTNLTSFSVHWPIKQRNFIRQYFFSAVEGGRIMKNSRYPPACMHTK